MHHAMTQVSTTIGLKKFKENGENAVSKELLQLHTKSTFIPLKAGDLTDIKKGPGITDVTKIEARWDCQRISLRRQPKTET